MPSIFTPTKFFFNRPINHQSTSNDRLKPVMTTGLVNMHADRSIANLAIMCIVHSISRPLIEYSVDPDQLPQQYSSQ